MKAPNTAAVFSILPQPTPTSCGPTCLSAVYRWFGESISINRLIDDVPSLPEGGTLGVYLGVDALRRGYAARIYSWNLHVLDPTWFPGEPKRLASKLAASATVRKDRKEREALDAMGQFVDLGGELVMEPLTRELVRRHLIKAQPILAGLSSTFLYQHPRQIAKTAADDDLAGQPEGHFVVCHGYARSTKTVTVYDPYPEAPFGPDHHYDVHIDRLITSILLGVLTYDANLLVIKPPV